MKDSPVYVNLLIKTESIVTTTYFMNASPATCDGNPNHEKNGR